MAQLVTLTISGAEQLNAMLAATNPALYEKAVRGGLRYAGKAGAVAAAKEIRQRYNLPSSRIKQDITGPSFSSGGEVATLRFSRRPPSAVAYGGVDRGKGLTVGYFRGGGRKPVPRGFIASGGKITGLPFRRTTKRRFPIAFVYGPSIGSVFAGESRFGDAIRAATSERINEQFVTGVDRVLSSAARGFGR